MSLVDRATVLEETMLDDRAVPRSELREWAERYGLTAGITLRGQGFSLALWSDEPAGSVLNRWCAFHAAHRPAFRRLVLGQQVHGTAIAWHEEGGEGWVIREGVDGHGAEAPGILLCVTVADCVPIYLAHPATGLVVLLHAGWRGVAGGILERGIHELSARAKAPPETLVMHCGVGICADCYEVGPEVVEALTGSRPGGPARLDLRTSLVERAARLRVSDITASPWCSAHDEAFFSHRRSRGADGRMVAYLGRPAA